MGKGFYWFLFACIVGVFGWSGNKVFKIENTEARVTVIESKFADIDNIKAAQEGYKTEVKYILQSLYRLENREEIELRNARLKRESNNP